MPHVSRAAVAALMISTATVAAPAQAAWTRPAQSAQPPTVLDQAQTVDAAVFGDTIAWLRVAETRHQRIVRTALVVRDGPGDAPRVLIPRLPEDTEHLAVGSDEHGRTTIVLASPRGLFTVATRGIARLRRVPGTRPGDATPALRDGTLSFSRAREARGRDHVTVRIGSLASGRSRQVWSVPSARTAVDDTALGADRTVLIETVRFGHANVWTSELRAKRVGEPSRTLLRQRSRGDDGGLGRATVDVDGRTVSATRWSQGGGHPNDQTHFSLPTGSRLDRTGLPDLPGGPTIQALLPLASGGSAADSDSGPFYLVP